jgi:signal transduction histidine kinase/ActR/RegA family two-component response regulator
MTALKTTDLLRRLRIAEEKAEYYEKIAEEAGKMRLRDTEELSILISKYRAAQLELQQARDELENRVRERTAELVAANAQLKKEMADRERIEQERMRLDAQLKQAQKLEAIGTLAGGIAHDFNNILSIIFGNVEIAIRKSDKDAPAVKYLSQTIDALRRAKDLVQQILTFSQQHEDKQLPVDLGETIEETFKLLRSSIPSTIDIKLILSKGVGVVMADATQIHQVIMNLCVNSCHAMTDTGGTIEVSLDALAIKEGDANVKPGHYVRLIFKDNGHGIDAEHLDRIFDPYFTTKKEGQGTGRGLAVVHGIVKKHRGDISVRSVKGEGTVFTLLFPSIERTAYRTRQEIKQTPRGKERILFIDDEPLLVETLKVVLENLGYAVKAFSNSSEALGRFAESPTAFDLVITDQTMPNLTGVSLARAIKQIRSDIPIVLCTGFSTQINKDNYREFGIDGFVSKPAEENDLALTIRQVLNHSHDKPDAPGEAGGFPGTRNQ